MMKVYYFSRRNLLLSVAVFALICTFLGVSIIYLDSVGVVSQVQEPIYQGNTGEKAVALTVNVDWGEEFIPAMLKEFKKQDARVTFFVTGTWARKNPAILKNMCQAGHSIQNHGDKHLHFNQLSSTQIKEQVRGAEKTIAEITGKKSRFFAPPYGEQNQQVVSAVSDLNYQLIMWSVDTVDWQRPAPEVITKRVMNRVHNDAIVLMHPTEPTLKALPTLIKELKDEGYRMVPIEEIVKPESATK